MRSVWQRAVLLVAAASAGCAIDIHGSTGVVARDEQRFTVAANPELTLATFDGAIKVRSWDRDEVLVEIEKRAPDESEAARLEVRSTRDGNRIRIEAVAPSRESISFGWGNTRSVSLTVTAPRRLTLRARTADGSIAADDLDGTFELSTGDGSIRLDRVGGNVTARSGDGSIHVGNANGRLSVQTGDGSVEIDGRVEDLRLETGDGSVRIEAAAGSAMKGDWTVRTGDGSIVLHVPASMDADIDAHSGDGRASASGPAVTLISASEEGDSLRARIGRGGHALRLASGDGSIHVETR